MTPLLIILTASHTAAPCADDDACNLNGRCKDGVCRCDAGWVGADCATLDLMPSMPHAGYRRTNVSSWGGSVHFDAATKRWQMFAAEMTLGCGIGAWEANSRIVRASSDCADGMYRFEEEVKGAFSHEPTVVQAPNGTWLLFHIGDPHHADFPGSQPPRKDCKAGYTPRTAGNDTGNFHPPMEILSASQLTGPWTRLPRHAGEGDINPAPWVRANGSLLLLWRIYPHILASTAASWRAAFSPP
jgi:hypothetical protein